MSFGIIIEHNHNAYGYESWSAWIEHAHIQRENFDNSVDTSVLSLDVFKL